VPELPFIHDPNFDYAALKANLLPVLLLYIFILPNLVGPVFGGIPFISHTWSIGTEEQFYAIWPWIIRCKSSSKKIRILAVIVGYLGIALFLSRAESGSVLLSYWKLFKIDCMAIGAFFAVLLFERNRILGLLYHPAIFYPVFFTVVVILLTGTHFPFIHSEIQAILYSVLILNLAANDAIRLNLDRGIMKNLGEISYGIYMYHPLCIGFTIAILRKSGMLCSPLLYLLTFATTLLISWASFQYFEKYFIRLKDRKFSF
jgi:peptidoglycan/LPS O-acetylase OafA/YrhL